MDKTIKHDLSADTTKLSFELLLRTANIAVNYSKISCERNFSSIQDASLASNLTNMKYRAQQLAQDAESLAIACDTLCVLQESKMRSEIFIIGKPPVT